MFKKIYEIIAAKKYSYIDPDIGILLRVGGYWRVEVPNKILGVSVKIYGSDRFGPNKSSLTAYKLRKDEIESIWTQTIKSIIEETRSESGVARFRESEFVLSEIIFGHPDKPGIEFVYAFNITSEPNEYGACVKEGKYECYYTLY